MRSWAIKKNGRRRAAALAFLLCLAMTGCMADEYSVVRPHEYSYWEGATDDILRAESYQDLVNTILLLIEEHAEKGTIRLYLTDVDYATALNLVKTGCGEVQEETDIGSYVLERLEFDMEELRNSYYEVNLLPTYRRTAEDVESIAEVASSGGIYDLLVEAWEKGEERVTVRCAHVAEERETLLSNILLLQAELEGDPVSAVPEETGGADETGGEGQEVEDQPSADPAPNYPLWEVSFYPPEGEVSIVEVTLRPEGSG